jgi:two-component system sensor histidine kinase KdpD
MLNEGWRRKERGTDVVIGWVQEHGRPQTDAQVRDLPVFPRKAVEYRGQAFEEMDLEGLLARRPELVLVDELAHTNIPGSAHTKRWEDVNALLDAGINVISTVNLQHLESLNDVVERITGVAQQETVPDRVVRAADQIELVDMAPEALRRRLAHGNIYPPERIDAALGNYFRQGNLTALRELALLWVADRVDEELHDYRERHDIAGPWETKERVVVSLTGAPGSAVLVRRAARMAMRTKAELVGVHVRTDDGLTGTGSDGLARNRALLDDLGGRFVEVVGADVAPALVQVARAENATQLVLGATHRSRLSEFVRGSVINSVIRAAGGALDVHVIATDATDALEEVAAATGSEAPRRHRPAPDPRRRRRLLSPLSARRRLAAVLLGVVGFPLVTLLLTSTGSHADLATALSSYLVLVVAVAATGGRPGGHRRLPVVELLLRASRPHLHHRGRPRRAGPADVPRHRGGGERPGRHRRPPFGRRGTGALGRPDAGPGGRPPGLPRGQPDARPARGADGGLPPGVGHHPAPPGR